MEILIIVFFKFLRPAKKWHVSNISILQKWFYKLLKFFLQVTIINFLFLFFFLLHFLWIFLLIYRHLKFFNFFFFWLLNLKVFSCCLVCYVIFYFLLMSIIWKLNEEDFCKKTCCCSYKFNMAIITGVEFLL